ncbi:beta-1,3-galactosyltransferase 2-like isoform X1 [Danio rerio]|uniref:Beta-1,3-galactosyltransferase 2-like isoform X1 n=1 Tax=Danio rerio TaxID=7955 RepID=A0AC58IHW6_DANRE
MVVYKITMMNKSSKRHNLRQSKQFVFLLKLTFSVCAIMFAIHIYVMPVTPPATVYNDIVKQIRSCYMINESHSTNITQNTTTVGPTATKLPSLWYHVAHPLNYHFIMDEPVKCSQWDPFVVLMVPAAPNQIEARNAIRSTWGNETTVQGKAVLTLFLVGLTVGGDSEKAQQQLEEESRQHRDLIQSNFVDSYFNLTIKTMVMMDWLATRCPQATYAMKIDTDMFLNVENLMTFLLAPNTPRENYLTGVLLWNRPVVRNKNSKWYVSEDMYPDLTYPTYPLGTGYVFSNDLPEKIVEISKEVQAFNIEDAYIGACLKRLGFEPSSPPDPSLFRIYMTYNREEFLKIISTDVGSPQQILNIWKDVKSPPKMI